MAVGSLNMGLTAPMSGIRLSRSATDEGARKTTTVYTFTVALRECTARVKDWELGLGVRVRS